MVAMKQRVAVVTAAAPAAQQHTRAGNVVNSSTKLIRTHKRWSSHSRKPLLINYLIQNAVVAGTRPRTHVSVVGLTV